MLINSINKWLERQVPFAAGGAFKTNSNESIARKEAMLELKEELEGQIQDADFQLNGEEIQIDISRGMGVDTSIPYVRFFDSRTPKATRGWSLVLFAHEDANSVALAIGLGVYKGAKKRETQKYTDQLLNDPNISDKLKQRLEIGGPGLAASYEAACPLSVTFDRNRLSKTSDAEFITDFKEFLGAFEYVLREYPPLEPAGTNQKISGKWLVQFNPGIWDFDTAVSEGVREISFRIGNYKDAVEVGDPVVLWRSGSRAGVVALGHVSESPEDRLVDDTTASYYKVDFDKDAIETRIAIRIDQVFENYIPKSDLENDLRANNIFRTPQSTSPFTVADGEFEAIISRSGVQQSSAKASVEGLAEKLLISPKWLRTIQDELFSKRQIILQGPPGTGKTFLALALADTIADGSALVQFHPSYSYEDFVEGFRPVKHGDGFGFELKPGPLVAIANEARSRPDKKFVLVIDEINRGNLAKVFGELYFLLEYRNSEVTMQYRTYGETFTLPQNLYFIGTMNTADRSISSLDMAIRRRFSFVDLKPSEEPIAGLLRRWLQKEGANLQIADLLEYVNSFIVDDRLKLGPSYFMKTNVEDDLEKIWNFQIMPQIKEVFFDNAEVIDSLNFKSVVQATDFQ
jgi:MoxR-like ATPase